MLDKWLVAENGVVKKGHVLVTVVRIKASTDMEAPQDGWVEKTGVHNGESVSARTVLAKFSMA